MPAGDFAPTYNAAAIEIMSCGTTLTSTRYDLMAQALGCYGELVEDPEQIRAALQRAFESMQPALLNVITDSNTERYSMSSELRGNCLSLHKASS